MMKEQVMRAIRFEAFGDPSVLELAEVKAPAVGEATALVRVMAASINRSDVKNVAGAMKQTTLPRIPGRDFAGVVEAGPADWIGAAAWGTGGDTGFTRGRYPCCAGSPRSSASIKWGRLGPPHREREPRHTGLPQQSRWADGLVRACIWSCTSNRHRRRGRRRGRMVIEVICEGWKEDERRKQAAEFCPLNPINSRGRRTTTRIRTTS
jgi:hypothetical protein